tara:strand:- start:185 stop:511 length:327 start_codon:yes stop_codon:yes gene_type:complete
MIKNKIKLLLLLLILLSSCQAVKDGLTGQKQNNSDEFLVTKKNRLEIPPDFDKLPIPRKDKKNINQSEQIDEEIEDLFKNSDASETLEDSNSTSLSAEEFVLKKIDKN